MTWDTMSQDERAYVRKAARRVLTEKGDCPIFAIVHWLALGKGDTARLGTPVIGAALEAMRVDGIVSFSDDASGVEKWRVKR